MVWYYGDCQLSQGGLQWAAYHGQPELCPGNRSLASAWGLAV